ncbi:MAG: OadG family protein [Lachnospiraceae bacterium]
MNNNKKRNAVIGFLIVFFVLGAISPFLAFFVILCFVIIGRKKIGDKPSGKKDVQYVFKGKTLTEPVKKQQGLDPSMKMHKDNTYDENKKSDYHGVSKENRDSSYTTRELYEDIANRKTDYRGVNKDLL